MVCKRNRKIKGIKTVKLDIKDIGRYSTLSVYVFVGSLNVNLEQVKRGLAWAYTEYLDRPYERN